MRTLVSGDSSVESGPGCVEVMLPGLDACRPAVVGKRYAVVDPELPIDARAIAAFETKVIRSPGCWIWGGCGVGAGWIRPVHVAARRA